MRAWAAAILSLVLLFTGCVGTDDGESVSANGTGDAEAPLPAPIRDEQRVQMGTSPVGTAQGQPCQTDASSCYRYPFQVDETAQVQARLDWTNATNDFDLHVVDPEGEVVASSNAGGPGTREAIDTRLQPGAYELVVVAWLVPEDTYALEAHFGYP